MKPNSALPPRSPPPRKRPSDLVAARLASGVQSRRRQAAAQWKSLAIGAFAIAAIFLALELTRQPQRKPSAATPHAEAVAKSLPAPAAVVAEETRISPSPAGSAETGPAAVAVTAAAVSASAAEAPRGPSPAEMLDREPALVLTGLDSLRDDAARRDQALFDRALDGKAWDAYRGLLAKSISAALGKLGTGTGVNRFDAVWKEAPLYRALLRWQVIGRLTEPVIAAHATDIYTGEVLKWLCHDTPAMEEFMRTVKPQDDAGKVLGFLMEAWPNMPEDKAKYYPLALACAVVFDREVTIPNPVGGSASDKPAVDPLQRLLWFIGKNEQGLLAAPVHHTAARDLVWVVCAPVSTSELDWAIGKLHMTRQHWGNTYGMVEYLMERAVTGLNPYKEYTFAEILKEGGICTDRTYFSANTARAQGIPAMELGGETDLGAHAWVALKIKDDEWSTAIGRVGGVSKGETRDPQTGETLSEQEVQLWTDRFHQSPVTSLTVARHLWLAAFLGETGKSEDSAVCVRLANQLGQSFTETWAALYRVLQGQTKLTGEPPRPSNLDEWRNFAKAMRREFKSNPRMAQLAANAEMEYIFPYGDSDDATRTLLRERRRIDRDSGEQADLIAASLKREADLALKRGDATAKQDISRMYDGALRKYGGSITGFKMMADDYFGYLKDDPELAHKAARDIELAFKRVVETGTKDWFRANTESGIYKMICGYYRACGDEERAVMLEKRYQVLLRRAERSAL